MSVLCLQFAEKFAEYKEAARLAKEKSQEKMEMATSPSQVRSVHIILTLPILTFLSADLRHDVYNEQLVNKSSKDRSFPLALFSLINYHMRHEVKFRK